MNVNHMWRIFWWNHYKLPLQQKIGRFSQTPMKVTIINQYKPDSRLGVLSHYPNVLLNCWSRQHNLGTGIVIEWLSNSYRIVPTMSYKIYGWFTAILCTGRSPKNWCPGWVITRLESKRISLISVWLDCFNQVQTILCLMNSKSRTIMPEGI